MNREAFDNLLASLPDAVFVVRLPERRIDYSNPAARQLFGYAAEELIGASTRLLHVDDEHFDRFHEITHPTLSAGEPHRGEFELRKRSGEVFATHHSISTFEDEHGDRFSVNVIRDISLQRSQEQRLRESESRFRAIAENLREVFWITDPDKTRMEYVSPGYEQIWGRSVQDLYADPTGFLDAIIAEDRERVLAEVYRQAEGTYDVEYRIERPDGSRRWIWDRAVPVRDAEGHLERIVGIAEDITALKRREAEFAQAQKMEAVGRLTGGIAHDFNNMLTVIMGNAELLAEEQGEDSLAREILEASQRASVLTGRLLSFARQKPLLVVPVDVNALIRETADFLGRTLGENVTVTLELADDLWAVTTDRSQLEASLINFAVNARDAMPTGGTLAIVTHNQTWNVSGPRQPGDLAPGHYVVIRVRDTGVGMTPEVVEHVFEPFFTTKAFGKGTGLGLPTVFGFAKDSGGHVEVASAPGRGSTFSLYLPRSDAVAPP